MWRVAYDITRQVIDDLGEKNAGLISAGVAFYGLFAIFPGIAATISLFGLFADPSVVDSQLDLMRGLMPPGVFTLFQTQIDDLLNAGSATLGVTTLLSIGLALWSARTGVAALIRGLNAIFDRPNRGSIRHIFVALVLTVSLIGMAIVALLAVVVAPILLAIIPFDTDRGLLLEVIRWLVAVGVLFVGLGMLYRYGPNRRFARLGWITPGAFLVVIMWIAMSTAFSIYVANFSTYNEVYGSLGAVIALLFWFYLSAYLILVGGALNVTLDRRKPL
ncbi:YihY/virulence factor BrkB family protein [Octadecabacter sp. G9-8]|uniref:YihY/virulence factor BrkB family protein n=1 Tax=Octadecabacter dasysiphoniae TaxID=2909341 RepID=A0ABS9CV35_9RHOB|nr:YihY/virulence factor BrkB family protein [Octadecabacter dasysiphoniae]MCF2870270.1 YihY/virulence factor BrkB family protein [Octadecabacter dasysiphoniae]